MAIVFPCHCGKPLRAQPESAGKKTKCPHCGAILTIPGGVPRVEPTPIHAPYPEPALQAAGVASALLPAASPPRDDDGLTLDLDWDSIEAPLRDGEATAVDPSRSSSGTFATVTGLTAESWSSTPAPAPAADGVRQYRVLGHKEQGVAGKFTTTRLEEALNSQAREGWCLKAAPSRSTCPVTPGTMTR